ncbi:hypothetical protein HID58_048615, partial [Brassica napus]
MEKVISGRLRKPRNIADRISISINLKMESQFYQAYSEAVADGRRRDHGLENKAFEIRYLGVALVVQALRLILQGKEYNIELGKKSILASSVLLYWGSRGHINQVVFYTTSGVTDTIKWQ